MSRTRFLTTLLTVSLVAALAAPAVSGAGLLDAHVWRTLTPAPAPSWYTPDLHRRAVAAGALGVSIPAEVQIPTSSLAFLGIRPGQLMLLTNESEGTTSLCTSNFVFTNGTQHFIGTAGHCGGVGVEVDMLVLPVGLVNIGRVVLSVSGPEEVPGNDFGLVSIAPSLSQYVSPSMAYWGGPTGAYTGSGPAVVQHAGWGLVVGTGGAPRVGLGTVWTSDPWFFEGIVTDGDSGSGANVLGGLAAGNITHRFAGIGENGVTLAAGTSMAKILQIAGAAGYQLETCASAIPWPLPGCP